MNPITMLYMSIVFAIFLNHQSEAIGYGILNPCTIDRQPPTECYRYSEYMNTWLNWLRHPQYARAFQNVSPCNRYVDSNLHVDVNNFKCFEHPQLGLLYVVHVPGTLEQNLQWTKCQPNEERRSCYNFRDRKSGHVQPSYCDNHKVLVFKPPHAFYQIPLHISDCICAA